MKVSTTKQRINRVMITFKDFLAEAPQWQNSLFDLIMTDYMISLNNVGNVRTTIAIPLSHSVLTEYFNFKNRKVAHIADITELPNLATLQRKKSKHISATTKFTKDLALEGIWGGGGTVFILRGDILVGADEDIWSVPTKQGTRVIDLSRLIRTNNPIYKKVEASYTKYMWEVIEKELRAYGLKNLPSWTEEAPINLSKSFTERTSGLANYFNRIMQGYVEGTTPKIQKDIGKIKNRIITKYMDYWARLFSAPTDTWFDILFSKMKNPIDDFGYNEVVLSNFTIEKVITLIDEDYSNKTIEYQEERVSDYQNKFPQIDIMRTYSAEEYMKESTKAL